MAVHATGPYASAALVPHGVGLFLRLRVRFAGLGLDTRVAAGEDIAGDPALALRSAQLASRRVRCRVAASVERVCRKPDRRPGFSAAISVHAGAVEVARPALLQLATALRCRESVRARGVALAQLLLTQAEGPLYRPVSNEALYEAAREALLALGSDEDLRSLDAGA
jgi:hypothetical protein